MNDIYSAKKINELIIDTDNKHKNFNKMFKQKIDFFNGAKTPTFINFKNNRNSFNISEIQLEKRIFYKKNKKDSKPNGIDDSANLDLKNILNNTINCHSHRNQNIKRKSMTSSNISEKLKYPMIYYLKINILMKLNLKQKFNKYLPANFMKSFTIYRNLIDISSYINLYKQFEILKKLILNQDLLSNDKHLEKKENLIVSSKNKGKNFYI